MNYSYSKFNTEKELKTSKINEKSQDYSPLDRTDLSTSIEKFDREEEAKGFQKLNFFIFVRKSFPFAVSYLIRSLLMLVSFGLYGRTSNIVYSGQISLVMTVLDLMSSGIRDFQKPIIVVCGPLYAKGEFYQYRLRRNQLALINSLLYLCFVLVLTFIKPFYILIGVEEQSLDRIMLQTYLYIFFYKPLVTASNFLKGRKHEQQTNSRYNRNQVPALVLVPRESTVLLRRDPHRILVCSGLPLPRLRLYVQLLHQVPY
jgi:hypothetical protein